MYYLAAGALIAILVFIHEFGHFIVAKLFGVAVPVFSFGFGRRLFGVQIGGTDYRVSALPFGGYVRMAGADPFGYGEEDDDELEDPSQSFLRKPVYQRLAVMAAGPASNLILPVLVFAVLYMAGEPGPAANIGVVERDSPAAEAGVLSGDTVVAVDGEAISNWSDMAQAFDALEAGPLTLTVERGGQRQDLVLQAEEASPASYELGLGLYRPDATVGVDDPRSPAGRAGLETGDRVLAVDGAEVGDFAALEVALRAAGDSVRLRVAPGEGADNDGADGTADEAREVVLRADPGWSSAAALELGPGDRWGISSRWLFVGAVSEELPDRSGGLLGGLAAEEARKTPAQRAGIQAGDRFVRIDGKPVHAWDDVLRHVRDTMEGEGDRATARAIEVQLVRAGELLTLELTPEVIEDTDERGNYRFRPVLGVVRDGGTSTGPEVRTYYGPVEALRMGARETVFIAGFIVETLGKVVTLEAAVDKTIGGPIEMMRQGAEAAKGGIFTWARLMGLLSISLGIVNLLPVPVLDGGQILFYAVEGLRGRPLSAAVRERAQQVGVLFLVLLMMAVVVFDLNRWITS